MLPFQVFAASPNTSWRKSLASIQCAYIARKCHFGRSSESISDAPHVFLRIVLLSNCANSFDKKNIQTSLHGARCRSSLMPHHDDSSSYTAYDQMRMAASQNVRDCDAWPPSLPLSLANCIWSIYRARTRRNKILWMTSNKQQWWATNECEEWEKRKKKQLAGSSSGSCCSFGSRSLNRYIVLRACECVCVCVDGRERVRPRHAQKFRWPYGCHTVSHLIETNYERITSASSLWMYDSKRVACAFFSIISISVADKFAN